MSKNQGYTLVELLVVIAIIGILFTIGFNNFQDYTRQQQLIALQRSIRTDILTAQQGATSGTKPAGCVNSSDSNDPNYRLNSYQFRVMPPATYEIEANCLVNGALSTITVDTVTIPVGATGFTISAPSVNPIIFKLLGQGTNIPTGGSTSIIITQTSTGNTRTITIGTNGNIQ